MKSLWLDGGNFDGGNFDVFPYGPCGFSRTYLEPVEEPGGQVPEGVDDEHHRLVVNVVLRGPLCLRQNIVPKD